jgi:hypothetical protein
VRVKCSVLHTGPPLARAVCNSSDFIRPTSSAALNGFGMTRSYAQLAYVPFLPFLYFSAREKETSQNQVQLTAPAAIAASTCSLRTLAVTAIIGRRAPDRALVWPRRPVPDSSFWRIARVAARPSRTGIWVELAGG